MQKPTATQLTGTYGRKNGGKSTQNSLVGSSDQSNSSTVIMRTAVPKYGNFQSARKKPQESDTKTGDKGIVREVSVSLSHLNKPSGRIMGSMSPIVVGHKTNEALKARTSDESGYVKPDQRTLSQRSVDVPTNTRVVHPLQRNIVQQKVKPTSSTQQSAAKSVKDKPISVVDPIQNGAQGTELLTSESAAVEQSPVFTNSMPSSDSFISNSNIFLEQWTKSASEAMCLKEENKSIKTQLEVQLQVNKELKRLLVASVGEDLCQKVEHLIRDKADLSAELGDFARKMSEDYENLDKVSIQADMWRSKYIASRLMIDELAKTKAYYGVQYQESQRVIQEVLNERHELRSNLQEAYRCLQHVRDAFDPLNTHKSSSLQSNNVIDLAKTIQNLAETIRFRLLPPGLAVNSAAANRAMCWSDGLTKAEASAQELLSRKVEFSEVDTHGSGPTAPPTHFKIDRYHPQTSFENLTLNCCGECTGEIKLI